MKKIRLFRVVGSFAENKDLARDIRIKRIVPALENNEKIILDFTGVDSATQSFIHALISEIMRRWGDDVLDNVYFENCNETIQKIINIVVEYMQEA